MRENSSRFVKTTAKMCMLVGLLGLSACGKDEEKSEADVEETGVDFEKNPLGALGQLAKAGQEMAEKAEEMEKHPPIAPVKFDALLPLLPSPEGWEKKREPRAETTQMGEFQISTATQKYEKGEGKERQTATVTIVDGSYVPMVYAPFTMMSKFAREGTDGHAKGMKVDGHPGFEEWKKRNGSLKLMILVKDRFLITIEGRNAGETLGRDWAKFIDLKLLSKWAEDEVTGDQVSPPPAKEEPKDAAEDSAAKEAEPKE